MLTLLQDSKTKTKEIERLFCTKATKLTLLGYKIIDINVKFTFVLLLVEFHLACHASVFHAHGERQDLYSIKKNNEHAKYNVCKKHSTTLQMFALTAE